MRKANDSWIELIPSNAAYLIEEDGVKWWGYRYFKHPLHYKAAEYNFTLYEQALQKILSKAGLGINLKFNDHYRVTLRRQADEWVVYSVVVEYVYHPIQKVEELGAYNAVYEYRNGTKEGGNRVVRKLKGSGLHQSVNMTMFVDMETEVRLDPQACEMAVKEVLPESTYIDYDQLRSVTKYERFIDIEKPEYLAKQYYYEYRVPFTKITRLGTGIYNHQYPIHFRYPKPSSLNFTKVALHPSDQVTISCNNGTQEWKLPEEVFTERGVANVFTGSIEDRNIVSMVTFILMIVAAIVMMKSLRK